VVFFEYLLPAARHGLAIDATRIGEGTAPVTGPDDSLGYFTFAYAAANPVTGTVTVNAGC
jgi:hypothetical protein